MEKALKVRTSVMCIRDVAAVGQIEGEVAGGLVEDPLKPHKSAHDEVRHLSTRGRPRDLKAVL